MSTLISLYMWAVGGGIFGAILVIGLILTYLFPPETYDPWIKAMLRFVFKAMRIRVDVEGNDKIDPDKSYLFMANHVSLFDVPLLGGFIPTFVRGVEADRQHKWFLYGWAVRRYGNIAIERDHSFRSMRSLRQAEQHIRSGKSIAILPEGHRTLDGKLGNFKRMPFFLAKQAEADIVPIGLSGLFNLKNKGSWHIQPVNLKIKFGDIIPADKVRTLSAAELRDLTRNEILALIERP
ncbi:1-acyl-sn-glycerol-3-phosphate acyltransferase [candidate division KSB1 bacterium]|nr:1-acyl-sn-glycerol-3-phosphate acyltransferase [candidate division KSB1 bacterium]